MSEVVTSAVTDSEGRSALSAYPLVAQTVRPVGPLPGVGDEVSLFSLPRKDLENGSEEEVGRGFIPLPG